MKDKRKKVFIYIVSSIFMANYGPDAIQKFIGDKKLKILKNQSLNEFKKNILSSKRVWVKGKSLKECMKQDKEINNNTIKCRAGYYKEIKIKE